MGLIIKSYSVINYIFESIYSLPGNFLSYCASQTLDVTFWRETVKQAWTVILNSGKG